LSNSDPREDGTVIPFDPFRLRSLCYEAAHICVGSLFYKGLIESGNLEAKHRDHAQIFEQGFSRAPRDFSDDIRFWRQNGFVLRDGRPLRGLPYPEPERLIQIVGNRDALATREDALAEARERKQKATVWEMDGFAHVDMVYGVKSSEWLAAKLDRRIQTFLREHPNLSLTPCSKKLSSALEGRPR
jgi:hypothetical protein